jgi:hypothetical protein
MSPILPIFLIDPEGGDVLSFDNVVAAQGYMEPPEVREGGYLVFDSVGHQGTPRISGWDVVVEDWTPEPAPAQLRDLLMRFLSDHGIRGEESADLPALITLAEQLAGDLEVQRTHPRIAAHLSRWWRGRAQKGAPSEARIIDEPPARGGGG